MDKIPETTPDLAAENAAKLLELFPECAGERGEVDFEKLKQTLADHVIDGDVERYQFTWPGKRAAMAEANVPTTKTLAPCEAESVNFATTENLYIEGDNLEVLKILRSSYLGQVKMIYIDPPYNTGKDFVYHDRFAITQAEADERGGNVDDLGKRFTENSESNPRYHSDWCSMMYPRLKLARDLLRDDGFLFMSLDDNESHNARKLLDDIFGEAAFIADVCHKARASVSNDKIVSASHNHVLWVCKDREVAESHRKTIGLDPDLSGFDKDDNDGRGSYKLVPVDGPGGARKGNPYYEFLGVEQYFRFSKETMERMYEDRMIVKCGDSILQKYLLSKARQSRKTDTTWWDDAGLTSSSTAALKVLMGESVFDNPKPVSLILRMLKLVTHFDSESLVLDFFSGSATTAHAVMQLNAEDGGKRKFIMVQLPEVCPEGSEAAKAGYKNICEIGKERIRRAGKKIVDDVRRKNEEVRSKAESELALGDCGAESGGRGATALPDVGFRVLKVVDSLMVDASKSAGETTQQELSFSSVKTGVTDDALLFHTLLRMGIRPTESIAYQTIEGNRVACVGGVALVAALDANTQMTNAFIEAVAKLNPGVAVFRDDTFRNNNALRISLEQTFKQLSKETKLEVI